MILWDAGGIDRAKQALGDELEKTSDPRVFANEKIMLAQVLHNNGEDAEAAESLNEALRIDPGNPVLDQLTAKEAAGEELKSAEGDRRLGDEFEKGKQEALKTMKKIAGNEFGQNVADVTDADGSRKKVDLSGVGVQDGVADPVELRRELMGNYANEIDKRTAQPNEQAGEIMRSFKTVEPPSPVKNISQLAAGDVILVAPVPLKDINKTGLSDVVISQGINFLDRWGSNNWSSPASHAAIYIGERNGKRWYLDNTSAHGPVIKDEAQFLKEYGHRKMDVATLVGQPLSKHEGEELWKAAHEMRNTTQYGPSAAINFTNDRMVCSEAARWALVRAGRRVPEAGSEDAKIGGVDIGISKRRFVNYSPSDFYEDQQYFVIHELGMEKK